MELLDESREEGKTDPHQKQLKMISQSMKLYSGESTYCVYGCSLVYIRHLWYSISLIPHAHGAAQGGSRA